jgi:chromatin assembly factor 1 subunit B
VAWDPLNEYIATQSSDRSMHIYRISTKHGTFEAHAVGKNTRMPHRHSRTPSAQGQSTRMFRSQSIASDVESVTSDYPKEKDETSGSAHGKDMTPLTPATSVASSSSAMFPPPPIDNPSSRRSSFSGSNAPGSPSTFVRYGRSPSPMPPLPAIRSLPSSAVAWASTSAKLYGDESFTNFFRRLSFSPDGGLLLTPAGQFEDPSVIPGLSNGKEDNGTPTRGRRGRPSVSSITEIATATPAVSSPSSVYIYSRANFARPPIAQLPGHKKASVAVKFSPVLYELRPAVEGDALPPPPSQESKMEALEKGVEGAVDVDVVGPVAGGPGVGSLISPHRTPSQQFSHSMSQQMSSSIAAPSPVPASSTLGLSSIMVSPAISPMDLRPPTPVASKPPTPNPGTQTAVRNSVFALPYRMLFAVVTMDTVAIYDTQQAGPVCLLTNLHYDEFTDTTW